MLKGKKNVAKRPEVKEKLRKNHWSKNPLYSKKIREIISKCHKGNTYTKGRSMPTKGKTYTEIYGETKAKQLKLLRSISMTRPKTQDEKRKMSLAKKGKYKKEKNPAWKGGKSFEEYGEEWTNELKTKIRKRDKFVCQNCTKNGFVIHHIDYNKKNNNEDNLITLCRHCHGLTGFNRNKWIKFLKK